MSTLIHGDINHSKGRHSLRKQESRRRPCESREPISKELDSPVSSTGQA